MLFEDDHLLVVNKPAGWNTHAPSPEGGEGIYDWLRHREPRWSSLAILHRLDKETSGVLVFGKTAAANRSLTQQFTEQRVRKRYLFLTDRTAVRQMWTVNSRLARRGSRYSSVSLGRGTSGKPAETRFTVLSKSVHRTLICAEPRTGRTHQIRVHAAESNVPVLGDELYGGSPHPRVCLHAESITLEHPADGEQRTFTIPADFESDTREGLRSSIVDPRQSNAYRVIHGASDGWPGWYVDRLGDFLLSQAEHDLNEAQSRELRRLQASQQMLGTYHKRLTRQVRRTAPEQAAPRLVLGDPAADRFVIRENGQRFELSLGGGYSIGLFLDQRDNRHRLLTRYVAAGFPQLQARTPDRPWEILNVFAYTCGFSICAAGGGAHTSNLDLSRNYLRWGRSNFELNGMDPAKHDFIHGDAYDWMKRWGRKGRTFDLVILDPPTFSQSKQSGVFRAEKDYGLLVHLAVPLIRSQGVLFVSTNAAQWAPGAFLGVMRGAIQARGRRVVRQHYQTQPPDFPVSRSEPAYLKTAWLLLD